MSNLPGAIEKYYADILYADYKAKLESSGVENEQEYSQALDKAKEDSRKITEALVGVKKERDVDDDGKEIWSWPSGDQLDISNIHWDGRDEEGAVLAELRPFMGEGQIFSTESP